MTSSSRTPAQLAADQSLEIPLQIRETLRTMSVSTFKRIPKSIKEELGVIKRKSNFLPKVDRTNIWKVHKRYMKVDKRTSLSAYERNDEALVPMMFKDGKYFLKLSDSRLDAVSPRFWLQVTLVGPLDLLTGDPANLYRLQPQE